MWPENWDAFCLFLTVRSQWTVGLNGPVGLQYGSVYRLIDRMGLSGDEWDVMFDDIQTMEAAALNQISEDRDDK